MLYYFIYYQPKSCIRDYLVVFLQNIVKILRIIHLLHINPLLFFSQSARIKPQPQKQNCIKPSKLFNISQDHDITFAQRLSMLHIGTEKDTGKPFSSTNDEASFYEGKQVRTKQKYVTTQNLFYVSLPMTTPFWTSHCLCQPPVRPYIVQFFSHKLP